LIHAVTSLAVQAVWSELLSGANSLLSGKIQGIFAILGVFGSAVSLQPSGFIGFFDQIPYATEQGIF
jgi:hypothetical protein